MADSDQSESDAADKSDDQSRGTDATSTAAVTGTTVDEAARRVEQSGSGSTEERKEEEDPVDTTENATESDENTEKMYLELSHHHKLKKLPETVWAGLVDKIKVMDNVWIRPTPDLTVKARLDKLQAYRQEANENERKELSNNLTIQYVLDNFCRRFEGDEFTKFSQGNAGQNSKPANYEQLIGGWKAKGANHHDADGGEHGDDEDPVDLESLIEKRAKKKKKSKRKKSGKRPADASDESSDDGDDGDDPMTGGSANHKNTNHHKDDQPGQVDLDYSISTMLDQLETQDDDAMTTPPRETDDSDVTPTRIPSKESVSPEIEVMPPPYKPTKFSQDWLRHIVQEVDTMNVNQFRAMRQMDLIVRVLTDKVTWWRDQHKQIEKLNDKGRFSAKKSLASKMQIDLERLFAVLVYWQFRPHYAIKFVRGFGNYTESEGKKVYERGAMRAFMALLKKQWIDSNANLRGIHHSEMDIVRHVETHDGLNAYFNMRKKDPNKRPPQLFRPIVDKLKRTKRHKKGGGQSKGSGRDRDKEVLFRMSSPRTVTRRSSLNAAAMEESAETLDFDQLEPSPLTERSNEKVMDGGQLALMKKLNVMGKEIRSLKLHQKQQIAEIKQSKHGLEANCVATEDATVMIQSLKDCSKRVQRNSYVANLERMINKEKGKKGQTRDSLVDELESMCVVHMVCRAMYTLHFVLFGQWPSLRKCLGFVQLM